MGFEEIDVYTSELQFRCLSIGSGPLILCLHGFPDTPHSFKPLMEELAKKGYRVVAPFMRGYAPTGFPQDGDFSILSLGWDVIHIMDALAVEKAIVVGHDWGATAAYTAAILEPSRIEKMVTAAVPHLRTVKPGLKQVLLSWYIVFFQIPYLPEFIMRLKNFAFIDYLYQRWSPYGKHWDLSNIKSVLKKPFAVRALLSYYRSLLRLKRGQWSTIFRKISVPSLVIAGEVDQSIGIELFEGYEEGFDGACQLVQMKSAGHFMHIEQAQDFVRHVLDLSLIHI